MSAMDLVASSGAVQLLAAEVSINADPTTLVALGLVVVSVGAVWYGDRKTKQSLARKEAEDAAGDSGAETEEQGGAHARTEGEVG